jgi:hypothetical protein
MVIQCAELDLGIPIIDYEPTVALTIQLESLDTNDEITPLTVPITGWASGKYTISLTLSGGTIGSVLTFIVIDTVYGITGQAESTVALTAHTIISPPNGWIPYGWRYQFKGTDSEAITECEDGDDNRCSRVPTQGYIVDNVYNNADTLFRAATPVNVGVGGSLPGTGQNKSLAYLGTYGPMGGTSTVSAEYSWFDFDQLGVTKPNIVAGFLTIEGLAQATFAFTGEYGPCTTHTCQCKIPYT